MRPWPLPPPRSRLLSEPWPPRSAPWPFSPGLLPNHCFARRCQDLAEWPGALSQAVCTGFRRTAPCVDWLRRLPTVLRIVDTVLGLVPTGRWPEQADRSPDPLPPEAGADRSGKAVDLF